MLGIVNVTLAYFVRLVLSDKYYVSVYYHTIHAAGEMPCSLCASVSIIINHGHGPVNNIDSSEQLGEP